MKKIIKFIAISVLVLFTLSVAGVFIFLKTFDFKRLKPVIITAAQKAVGRPVNFDDIALNVSFKEGLRLNLTNVVISEDPAFGSNDFLKLKEINLGVSIKDFIFKREIRVLNVEAKSPRITIIKGKDGCINYQSLISAPPEKAKGAKPQTKAVGPAATKLPALFINRINVNDMLVVFIDRTSAPEINLECRNMKLTVEDFSLTGPFRISLAAAFASKGPDLTLAGTGEFNLIRQSFSLKDTGITVELVSVSLDELRRSIPQFKKVPLSDISGRLTVVIRQLEAGPKGLALTVDADLKDGKATLPQIAEGISLAFQRIGASVKDFSLKDAFSFKLEAAYGSPKPNLIAQGKARVLLDKHAVEIKNTDITADLSGVSMVSLKDTIAALKDASLPEELKGIVKVSVEQLNADAAGLSSLKANGTLNNGYVRMKTFIVPLESIQSKFSITEKAVVFSDTSVSIGKGTVELSGEINDYFKEQDFHFKTKAADIDLAGSINQDAYPVKCKGLVSGTFEFKGKGFDANTLLPNLNGNGSLELKEGRLAGMNIFKLVLDKLLLIPNLTGILESALPAGFKEKLLQKDTVVTSLTATAVVNNGRAVIQPITLVADDFKFEGKGEAGFDRTYSFDGSFSIPPAFSSRMVEAVPEMKLLQDTTQQLIRFPLKVSGKGSKVSFMPDVKSLGVAAVKDKVTQELEKLFDKVFEKDKGEPPKEEKR